MEKIEKIVKLSLILVPLNLLDILTTYFALGFPNTAELNPLWLNMPFKILLSAVWVGVIYFTMRRARKEDLELYEIYLMKKNAGEFASHIAQTEKTIPGGWFKLGWLEKFLGVIVLAEIIFYSLVLLNNFAVIFYAIGAL